jgi:hypothetical protein
MEQQQRGDEGFVSLILVSVVCAVGLFVALSVFANNKFLSMSVASLDNSTKAKALADACIEEGLSKVRVDDSVSGSFSISFTSGSCSYSITNNSPTDIVIQASGLSGRSTERVRISITATSPEILIGSYQEGF